VAHYAENSAAINNAYNRLHGFLSQLRFLTLPASRFNRNSRNALQVTALGREFAEILGAMPYDVVLSMAQGDQLIAAKVLLSIERRLKKLYEFFLQGRVAFSD
jgi:hypothetical protein